jgi:hypothetical protein
MIAIVLCISVLLPLVFTSCAQKTPKTADELIDKVEDVMDDVGSYEQKLEMELEVWVSGTKMSMNAVGKGILIDTEEDYYYYNSMDMEMTTGSSKTSEETTRIEVYDGGKVYFLEDANEKVIAQSSDATAAEHRAYIEDKGDIDDYIYDCETKEFSKNEDGSWELVLADYEDEALDGIYESAGLGMLFDAGTIRDIKVEMLVAEDFRVLEYELKFKFNEDNDGNKPQAVFKSEFSKHGEATREKLDTDGYQSIKGLLGMKRLEQPCIVEISGKKFCLGHGDGLGPVPSGYRFLRGVFHNRVLQILFSMLHPWIAFRFGNGWSKENRLARKEEYVFKGEDEPLYKFAADFAKTHEVDHFIFGHYHVAVSMTLSSGASFNILKDWIDASPYICFDGESLKVSE